jgi:DoxX-like family
MTTALGIVLAVVFALLGIAKLASVPAMRGAAAHLGYTTDQYRAIGALETAGALGIVIGLKDGRDRRRGRLGPRPADARRCLGPRENHDAAARVVVPIAMAAIAAAYLFSLR